MEVISELKKTVFKTGIRVEEMLQTALDALFNCDEEKRNRAINKYSKIINRQMEIEAEIMKLIPMLHYDEKTIRDIISILKISVHLERIASRCRYIAKTEIVISFKEMKSDLLKIRNMIEKSIDMFIVVLEAFKNEDADKAENVAYREKEIVNLYNQFNIRIKHEMQKNPGAIDEYLKYINLNRDIERLSDHLASICEWIYFDITGKRLNFKVNEIEEED